MATAASAATAPPLTELAKRVPLAELVPGPNPRRKKPDQAYIDQIAESMQKHNVIEPLIVRPLPGDGARLQIVCGETRFTAAQLAGLVDVPVVIRDYSDDDVLEVQLVENIQRNSMHPIDEGEAFARLIKAKKHSPESLAKTIGKSVRWVYNRLEFTKLIPSLRDAFLKDELTASHAELLARLTPEDQKRIDNRPDSQGGSWRGEGLWRWDYLPDPDATPAEAERQRRSVRSLRDVKDWIQGHVRLAIDTSAVQNLLPEIEEVQLEAAREEKRVLQVATVFLLPQDPKLKSRFEGVLTDRHWKRAGGKSACEFAERGVIVFGAGQGDVLDVCVQKKKCRKHWPEHQPAAKARRAKQRGNDPYQKGTKAYEARVAREAREHEAERRKEQRWGKLGPALRTAMLAIAKRPVSQKVLNAALARLGMRPASPAALPQLLVAKAVDGQSFHWHGMEARCVAFARDLGVDVKAVLRAVSEPKAAPAKRKAGKKR